jgi:hypothetical protein
MRSLVLATLALALAAGAARAAAPYPKSGLVTGIAWSTATHQYAGLGGDLWPVTAGADRKVYTAWGDGTVTCPAYVSYGTASLPATPGTRLTGIGCGALGYKHGKIVSLLDIRGTLYALVGLQAKGQPDLGTQVWRSDDHGKTWQAPAWTFAGADLRPSAFVNRGPGYADAPDGYVYLLAPSREARPTHVYLMRVPAAGLADRAAYRYLRGAQPLQDTSWVAVSDSARPIFTDPNGIDGPEMVYDAALGRYLLTVAHGADPDNDFGRLGLFEARQSWGPWRTVEYEDAWLGIAGGSFLGLGLPTVWMSADGRSLWGMFTCYGRAACGTYHDRLNIMQATLTVATGHKSAR